MNNVRSLIVIAIMIIPVFTKSECNKDEQYSYLDDIELEELVVEHCLRKLNVDTCLKLVEEANKREDEE